MLPLVSVIVPVYNGEAYLEKCIESLENQTYENLEIIIVNDGSTDGTGAVCVRLKKRFDNIHVISTEDAGVSAARNAGIRAAKGTYITFVDADDRLRPRAVEVLYGCISETGSDVAGCRFYSFGNDAQWQSFLGKRYRIEEPRTYAPAEYLKEQVLNGNSRCWSKLYRRAAVGNLGFQEGLTIGEDMLFLVRLLPYIRSVSEISYPGYGYYQNPKGAMNRRFTPRYMDQITCWELARKEILEVDPRLYDQVTMILIMGILLTVGKLAALSPAERKKNEKYVRICYDKLKEESRAAGACRNLPEGYQVKRKFFLNAPGLYLFLYHFRDK